MRGSSNRLGASWARSFTKNEARRQINLGKRRYPLADRLYVETDRAPSTTTRVAELRRAPHRADRCPATARLAACADWSESANQSRQKLAGGAHFAAKARDLVRRCASELDSEGSLVRGEILVAKAGSRVVAVDASRKC
jgi:hypothetical protein